MKPRLTAYRKITKDGNSLHIAPPRTFLQRLGLLKGDFVELVLDEYSRRFWVKPVKRRRPTRGELDVEQPLLEEVL